MKVDFLHTPESKLLYFTGLNRPELQHTGHTGQHRFPALIYTDCDGTLFYYYLLFYKSFSNKSLVNNKTSKLFTM